MTKMYAFGGSNKVESKLGGGRGEDKMLIRKFMILCIGIDVNFISL
jgi:hypothetical protein